MLGIYKKKPVWYVTNVDALFCTLTYADIFPYLSKLKKLDAFKEILWNPVDEQPIDSIQCRTSFGICFLSQLSTSIKIIALSMIAISKNKPLCFMSGLLGDNYVDYLSAVCKNTNLISLYCPEGRLPQTDCDYETVEANVFG
jgi:hypothetical protein